MANSLFCPLFDMLLEQVFFYFWWNLYSPLLFKYSFLLCFEHCF